MKKIQGFCMGLALSLLTVSGNQAGPPHPEDDEVGTNSSARATFVSAMRRAVNPPQMRRTDPRSFPSYANGVGPLEGESGQGDAMVPSYTNVTKRLRLHPSLRYSSRTGFCLIAAAYIHAQPYFGRALRSWAASWLAPYPPRS
jgi:hypothetical protein